MSKIAAYAHFFEFFTGSNAALLGFDELRKKMYDFFLVIKKREFSERIQRVQSPLKNLRELCEASPSLPVSISDINEQIGKYDRLCTEIHTNLDSFLDSSGERIRVKRQTYPLIIICLLYSLMMVLLGATSEAVEHLENSFLMFLGYLNVILLVAFCFFKNKYNKPDGTYREEKINEDALGYLKLYFVWLGIAFVLTMLNIVVCHFDKEFGVNVWWVPIIISTCLICAGPIINLIHCAFQWKGSGLKLRCNTHHEKISKEEEAEPKHFRQILEEFLTRKKEF